MRKENRRERLNTEGTETGARSSQRRNGKWKREKRNGVRKVVTNDAVPTAKAFWLTLLGQDSTVIRRGRHERSNSFVESAVLYCGIFGGWGAFCCGLRGW